jgi:ceramide glucosyltransferase
MTSILAWFVVGLAAVAGAYRLFELVCAVAFFRDARRKWARWSATPHTPAVTILKPLKGCGIDLYENLVSFCRQQYAGRVQIVCGVADAADPAAEIVTRLQRDFPQVDIVLAVGDEHGANRKVANLIHMMRYAKHATLVLSDADIRVRPDYLATLVTPLGDPRVGLAHCLYRGVGDFGLPSTIEGLLINTDFIPMVMVARWVQGLKYAYGASIALKREALDAIGGWRVLADYLADDYQLGNRVHKAGYEIALLPYVVETVLDSVTLHDVFRHQLRWARTYRACQPFNWFMAGVTQTTMWGLVAVAVTGGSLLGVGVLAAGLVCRFASVVTTMALLGDRDTVRYLGLVPLKDLAYSAIWVACWFGRDVNWSGQRLRVEPDGRMTPLTPVPSLSVRPAAATPGERRAQGGGIEPRA